MVNAAEANVDLLAGQIVERGELRRLWTGHDDLADAGVRWRGEVDDLLPFRCDDDRGERDVAAAVHAAPGRARRARRARTRRAPAASPVLNFLLMTASNL